MGIKSIHLSTVYLFLLLLHTFWHLFTLIKLRSWSKRWPYLSPPKVSLCPVVMPSLTFLPPTLTKLPPDPQQPLIWCLSLQSNLHFLGFYMNKIMQYVFFLFWCHFDLVSFTQHIILSLISTKGLWPQWRHFSPQIESTLLHISVIYSFFLMSSILFIDMTQFFLIHSPIDEHLDCFQFRLLQRPLLWP